MVGTHCYLHNRNKITEYIQDQQIIPHNFPPFISLCYNQNDIFRAGCNSLPAVTVFAEARERFLISFKKVSRFGETPKPTV
jgi:hypothetical protein